DHLLDLSVGEQDAETLVGGAAVVADDGELFGAELADGADAVLGVAAQPEAAGEDGRALAQIVKRGAGIREGFIHRSYPSIFPSPRIVIVAPSLSTRRVLGICL